MASATESKAASKAAKKSMTNRPAAKAATPAAGKAASSRKAGAAAEPRPKKNGTEAEAKPEASAVSADKAKEKQKKEKMVRDSFAMPESEYKVLGEVKRACLKDGIAIKKSELLRIGVELIRQMKVADLKKVLSALPPMKAGRPKKSK